MQGVQLEQLSFPFCCFFRMKGGKLRDRSSYWFIYYIIMIADLLILIAVKKINLLYEIGFVYRRNVSKNVLMAFSVTDV